MLRLNEPVDDAAAALICEELSQTSGAELAGDVEVTHPATRVEMFDEDACSDPDELRTKVEHALVGAPGALLHGMDRGE